MFRKALGRTPLIPPRRFAGGSGAHPQKLGDKTHLETVIVASGQFMNTANNMLGSYCKKFPKEPVAFFSEKSRTIHHDYSKDLHAHQAFKNEDSIGKGLFAAPKKGYFYKIDNDVIQFDPANNKIVLQERSFTYDHLILASEFNFDLPKTANLEQALADYWNSHVLSSAQLKTTGKIDRAGRDFRYDNFVINIPPTPAKNEGTNHIFYFFDYLMNDKPMESIWYKSKLYITTGDDFIHRVPFVNDQLLEMANKRGVEVLYNLRLIEIKYNNIRDPHRVSELVYRNTKTGQIFTLSYGMLVTYPESSVPKVLEPFLNKGFIDVDPHTLQHKKYSNVFALGECTNLPTINNTISVCNQSHIVAGNVGCAKSGGPLKYGYDGTSATPIFTGKNKIILPGFKYGWEPVSTGLTTDTTSPLAGLKQSVSFKLFKRYEKKYFEKKMQGKIYGPSKWTKPGDQTLKLLVAKVQEDFIKK